MRNTSKLFWAINALLLIVLVAITEYQPNVVMPLTPPTMAPKTPTTPLQYHPSPTPTMVPVMASQ